MAYEVTIFGKKVKLKDNLCTNSSSNIIKGELYYNLYISITDVCLGNCKFCNNNTKKQTANSSLKIDVNKLAKVLKELNKKVKLNRISITGGEPLLNIPLLNDVVNTIFSVCGKEQPVTINTNGINLNRILELDNLNLIEGIHISRHHYNDDINDQIFGFKTAHQTDIQNLNNKLQNKKLLRLNCLLIKDYIDQKEEIKKYLEFASKVNIFRVGFVGLMPINEYSKQHYVEYKDALSDLTEAYNPKTLYNQNTCDCTNGIYHAQNGNFVQFYARVVRNLNPEYAGQFNYGADNTLSAGFGNVIYK